MACCCIEHAKCGTMNFHTRLSALVAWTNMMTWIYQKSLHKGECRGSNKKFWHTCVWSNVTLHRKKG